MKIKFEAAEIINEPNRPKPLNQESAFLRVISPLSSMADVAGFFIVVLLLLLPRWRFHQVLNVRPENLILRIFQIAEIILFHGKHENQYRSNAHAQTGEDREPGHFHTVLTRRRAGATNASLLGAREA